MFRMNTAPDPCFSERRRIGWCQRDPSSQLGEATSRSVPTSADGSSATPAATGSEAIGLFMLTRTNERIHDMIQLKDFIAETLRQIIEGVKSAQEVAEKHGGKVSPKNLTA